MARVLVVDDAIIMRNMIKTILQESGHEVVAEADSGIVAYKAYQSYLPDVVTMDISMPEMNGIEALKKISLEYPDARIIMVSAMRQRSMLMEAIRAGARHYLIKPINKDKLLATINEILKSEPTGASVAKKIQTGEEKTSESRNIQASPKKSSVKPPARKQVKPLEDKPFEIQSQGDSIVVVRIGSLVNNSKNVDAFYDAMTSIIEKNPQNVIIDLRGVEVLSDDMVSTMVGVTGDIKEAGGKTIIVSLSIDIITLLKENNVEATFKTKT